MAIVIGSTFKPFDYATMNNPVAQATQEHKLLEDAYGELATKASIWEGMANQQADPKAYQTYLQYANDLHDQANVLAKQGLNPMAKRALNDMKSRYAQEITPIEQAYQKREANTAEQRKAKLQNPTIIFDRDFSTTSLDELIENPSLSYTNINGDVITKQVAQAASNLAKQVRTDPRKWYRILGDQYYETTMKKGLSDNEILATISQTEGGKKELQKIIDGVINTSGVTSWNNPDALNQVREYANRGAWAAIGDVDWKTLQNQAFQAPSSEAAPQGGEPLKLPTTMVAERNIETPYSKNKKIFEGANIKENEDGVVEYSTNFTEKLDKRNKEIDERLKAINEKYPVDDPKFQPSGWNPVGTGSMTSYNTEARKAKAEADALKAERASNVKKRKEAMQTLLEVSQKYKHLGDSEADAITKGLAIDKAQSKQQLYVHPIITGRDSRDGSDFIDNITKTIKNLTDDTKSGLVKLDSDFTPKDEAITAGKAKEILGDKGIGVGIVPGVGFVITSRNERYLIRGIREVDAISERLGKVDNFLKSFTNSNITNVPKQSEFGSLEDMYRHGQQQGENLGDGMVGIMVRDDNGDTVRVVLRPTTEGGLATYRSSAEDEIKNHGSLRGESLSTMAISELPYILTTTEGVRRQSPTLPSKETHYNIER